MNAMITLNGKPLHHTVVKKAAKLGFHFVDNGKNGLRLVNDETGALSEEIFTSTAEAFEAAAEEDGITWNEEDEEEGGAQKCGVMAKSYHTEYSSNPHGPGCGDTVDVEMRNAIMVVPEGEKEPRVDEAALRKIGDDAGLWREKWNGLNVGMRRMNLSNRIRGLLRNDADAKVRIGKVHGRFGVAPKTPKVKAAKKIKATA